MNFLSGLYGPIAPHLAEMEQESELEIAQEVLAKMNLYEKRSNATYVIAVCGQSGSIYNRAQHRVD